MTAIAPRPGAPARSAADAEFASFVDQHRRDLLAYASLLAGDRHLGEEVVAEALARFVPRWRRGGVERPELYVRRVIFRLLIARRRRWSVERRHERAAVDGLHPRGLVEPFDGDGAGDRELVARLLAELPVDHRAVVVLRFLEDRSEAETAEVLGVAAGTVKSRTSRALERLRVLIEAEETGDA